MMIYNINVDLVNDNVYRKFGQFVFEILKKTTTELCRNDRERGRVQYSPTFSNPTFSKLGYNKNLKPKMILTWYFACTREVIKSLNQNSSKWRDLLQMFKSHLSIIMLLFVMAYKTKKK